MDLRADEGVRVAATLEPDVVLLSLHDNNANAVGPLRHETDAKIIVVSDAMTGRELVRWVDEGADAMLAESADPDDVIHAVKRTAVGQRSIDAALVTRNRVLQRRADPPHPDEVRLSKREFEIVQLLASGLSPRDIAAGLFISRRTVETHLLNIYRKLHVHNQLDAIAWYERYLRSGEEAG